MIIDLFLHAKWSDLSFSQKAEVDLVVGFLRSFFDEAFFETKQGHYIKNDKNARQYLIDYLILGKQPSIYGHVKSTIPDGKTANPIFWE